MKRPISTVLVLAAFAALLSACGPATGLTSSAPAPAPASADGQMTVRSGSTVEENAMAMDGAMATDGSMMMDDPVAKDDSMMMGDSMAKDDSMMSNDSMVEPAAMAKPEDRYVAYSPEAVARASQQGRAVLFFKADWCPTCQTADRDFQASLDQLPGDVTVLTVNYDQSAELKRKYAITYQHTFVQVDRDGNPITRWSGGSVRELLENLEPGS